MYHTNPATALTFGFQVCIRIALVSETPANPAKVRWTLTAPHVITAAIFLNGELAIGTGPSVLEKPLHVFVFFIGLAGVNCFAVLGAYLTRHSRMRPSSAARAVGTKCRATWTQQYVPSKAARSVVTLVRWRNEHPFTVGGGAKLAHALRQIVLIQLGL
jgi:hypothetical protein